MNAASAPRSGLGSEFDAFLFAPIGDDNNGLPLRIVSLLGRLDLDPWAEASILARLPTEAAAQKLTSLLAALPVASLKQAHLGTMATHLVALLPHQTALAGRSLGMLGTDSISHPRPVMRAIGFAIWLIWLLGLQVIMARRDAPPHADTTQLSAPLVAPSDRPAMAPTK
jgi:hypothetical protein